MYSLLPQTAASLPMLKLDPLFLRTVHIGTVKQQSGNGWPGNKRQNNNTVLLA